MLANINLRTLMLMTPIGFCTLLQFFSGSFFITQEEHYILKIIIPWLFSLGVAMILPNNNRIWMMTGTSLAYCVVINVLWHMQPNFQQSEILASFLGPLTSSILSPKTGHRKKNYKSFFVNYSLAIFFVIVLSLLLSICASFLYENIGSGINRAYLSSVYDSNFSFIYSMIYQFCQTFGFGQFITEIRAISPQDATSVSFYATTLAINISMIPAIYAAIFICQQRKRKTMYATFFLISLLSSTSGSSVSFLILSLIWMYPTLFAYYLILCLFFYFIGQYIDFNIYVNSQNFYQPNVLISEINIFDTKFLMFCTFMFIITVVSSTFLILQDKKNIHQTRTIKRVKQIKINVLADDEAIDYTVTAVNYIKLLGGFNNIIKIGQENNFLNVTVINPSLVNTFGLYDLGAAKQIYQNDKHKIKLLVKEHCLEIHKKIVTFAERQFLDIDSDFKEIQPFDISKTDYYSQIQNKEPLCLGSK
jgi:phosphotransferase system IIB component